MTSPLMCLAVNCVRGWTRLYTWRLSPASREARRAEIESDLWEFQRDVVEEHSLGSARHLLLRLLLGIPDDLGWRVEQEAAAGTLTQGSIALIGRMAGAAFCICALWLIHGDAGRRRPAIARLLSGPPLSAQAAPQSTQADRFVAKLLQNRYALSVRSGQLSGAGAQVLQSAIAQSRFVLLGEYHGVAQTPEFWAAVCKAARPAGFHTMAVEEGPLVAAELEGWARRPDGAAQLAAFEKRFPESINIYDAREEFDMLQQCARVGQSEFRLWGLNQEMYGAAGLILSRVVASRIGSEARPAMQQLLQKNDDAYRKAVQSGSIFDLFMIAADDKELASGAALLLKDGSPEARSLFASLVESHEINRTPPAVYGNARRRERLMKTLFAANYARAASTAPAPPKVLLKFGAFHGYRGLNPVHGSGIGNYVAEFAETQGAQSLHIYLMPVKGSQPIHPKVGQPAQLRPFNLADQPGWRYLQPIFSNLLQSDWTMFDLRPLRQDVAAPGGAVNPELATLVFGYDILVMVREGTPSTEIR